MCLCKGKVISVAIYISNCQECIRINAQREEQHETPIDINLYSTHINIVQVKCLRRISCKVYTTMEVCR